ncbi:hypothetical protein [Actinoplanes aureus]|uniref:hypothetical protein n=1 Tax=Actinoplanes aureus TaxID=2792083 RepID=UPI001E504592|nr:hypothetical protein [Actinoplanes aureus]
MSSMVEQTRHEIRFALSQLAVRNGQHEFETLTRMLARATVTRNVLVATGPVAAGGDQGRDFETYRTDLAGQTQPLGRALGLSDHDSVGFACTLQQDKIGSKIRGDVAAIMSSGTAVTYVLVYCEVDVPVARRHQLQDEIRASHGIHLEIFDGAGIAELLTQHATFWIAEQYLHLPSRTLPPPPDRPDWYEADLARWRAQAEPARTWGDYVDVAADLRYAYQHRDGREDLPFWLDRLAPLLTDDMPPPLRHAARHQTILAHHLGLGSMRPIDHLIAEEIETAVSSTDVQLVADATVLMLLTCAAFARDETGHTAARIMTWNAALISRVSELLSGEPYPGETCSLLESLAALNLHPDLHRAGLDGSDYRADDATTDFTVNERMRAIAAGELSPLPVPAVSPTAVLDAFERLAATLPAAVLYPVEHAARFLTVNMVLLMDDPRYERIADDFDRRLADTAGADVAADQAVDRAKTFFAARRILDGLRQMHRARLRLLHGEAGPRLLHATLATAEAYQQLHLFAAAKYYGLLAANLTQRDELGLFPQGLQKAAAADYHQGNWASAALLNREAIAAHTELAERPFDFELHPWLGAALFELINIKAFADKLEPAVQNLIAAVVTDPSVAGLFEAFTEVVTSGKPAWWHGLDVAEHADHIAASLRAVPFADTAVLRRIRFAGLGVDWTVEFAGADVVVGERFAAALQIMLAHLAAADPVLLPTRATIHVTAAAPGGQPAIDEEGSTRDRARFRCVLPESGGRGRHHAETIAEHTLIAVTTVIVTLSALPDAPWRTVLDQAFADDLAAVTFFALPYDTAYANLAVEHDLDAGLTGRQLVPAADTVAPEAGPGLGLPQTPGPGYSVDRSHDEIRFKYQDLPARMRPTLAVLRRDRAFAATVAALREQGWPDWHILLAVHNRAKNVRMNHRARTWPTILPLPATSCSLRSPKGIRCRLDSSPVTRSRGLSTSACPPAQPRCGNSNCASPSTSAPSGASFPPGTAGRPTMSPTMTRSWPPITARRLPRTRTPRRHPRRARPPLPDTAAPISCTAFTTSRARVRSRGRRPPRRPQRRSLAADTAEPLCCGHSPAWRSRLRLHHGRRGG